MKVALIHYWLVNVRGGEKVLEALCELFPDADIFTHVYVKPSFKESIIYKHNVYTSFISKLPFSKRFYQLYLPFMPLALEELDLHGYDLIISSESGPAKGIIPPPGVKHICYCHSPMRYAWDMYHLYKKSQGYFKRKIITFVMHYLRRWDQQSSLQVSRFVANSKFVQQRISSYYNRDSDIIYPPVAVNDFQIAKEIDDHYLMLGQLVTYKRPDLAIEAFNTNGKSLIVVGDGEMLEDLKKMSNPNINFLGRADFLTIKKLMSTCKALIFPGAEDFGIVPVEVMASGRPVIAYKRGGALETVIEGESGLFFNEQSADSLNEAITDFEARLDQFDSISIRTHALKFSKERFKNEIASYIQDFTSV